MSTNARHAAPVGGDRPIYGSTCFDLTARQAPPSHTTHGTAPPSHTTHGTAPPSHTTHGTAPHGTAPPSHTTHLRPTPRPTPDPTPRPTPHHAPPSHTTHLRPTPRTRSTFDATNVQNSNELSACLPPPSAMCMQGSSKREVQPTCNALRANLGRMAAYLERTGLPHQADIFR
jgi:hypothetical protein